MFAVFVTTCVSSSELLELPFETHENSSFSHFRFFDVYLYLYSYLNLYKFKSTNVSVGKIGRFQ